MTKGELTADWSPDEEYRELVQRVAESRPRLTEGQRDELAAIIRASRVRQETGRLRVPGEPAHGEDAA